MRRHTCIPFSFWQLASPDQACRALVEMYGDRRAKWAAVQHASAAQCDGHEADHRFWLAVLCRLYGIDPGDYAGSGRLIEGRNGES